ncbi:Scaffold-type E3 ligase [Onygenales sp. PD_12]|nr:Scaffold-type E3 ligase [Onygenales sp. PD_12]
MAPRRARLPIKRKYYQTDNGSSADSAALNKLFDSYRDAPEDKPDTIGLDGAMKYFGDIGVQMNELVCFAIAEFLRSPTMGEFTREHFVQKWGQENCDTIAKQSNYAARLRSQLPIDPALFRRVYRYVFPISCEDKRRTIDLEIAIEYWNLFFTPATGGIKWNTRSTRWLDLWVSFVQEHWKKPVSKDLWEQTEVFMRKTQEDESLSWWSEDGAWPGLIDEFVAFVQAKRPKGAAGEAMEVE